MTTMPSNYRIEVWSFPIAATGGAASHRFLVMVDGNGNTVRELHGGAEGPNGTFKTTALSGTLFTMEGDPNRKAAARGELPYAENPVASTGSGLASSGRRERRRPAWPRPWRGAAAATLAGGLLAACAPPPFTVSPSYGAGPRSEYFDRNMLGALPGQEARLSNFLGRLIVSRGDNETSRLLSIIAEAGGNCTRSGARYNCLIDRQYVFSGCAFGRCSSSERRWQLRIGWNASEANFIPDVRATVSPPNPITSNS